MEDNIVWFLWPQNVEEPVRMGEVQARYDDGSVDIWDNQLGDCCVEETDIFSTLEEAEAEFDRRGL